MFTRYIENAGTPSSPLPHQNPQCGINRKNPNEFGICRPATSWNSPRQNNWFANNPPSPEQMVNECYNCHDDIIHLGEYSVSITGEEFNTHFFCDLLRLDEPNAVTCGGDLVNPLREELLLNSDVIIILFLIQIINQKH